MAKCIIPTQEWKNSILEKVQIMLKDIRNVGEKFSLNVGIKIEIPEKDKPVIQFSMDAILKIYAYVANNNKEIGWHGVVDRLDNNIFYIRDVFMYPQMQTAATVTTDDKEYIDWMNNLDDDTFNHLRFHGHSHVNMGVSPSTVDETYQQNVVKDIKDFYIFMILNKSHKMYAIIYDVEHNIIYEPEDILVDNPIDTIDQAVVAEMKQYTKEAPITAHEVGQSSPSFYDNYENAYWKNYYTDTQKNEYYKY